MVLGREAGTAATKLKPACAHKPEVSQINGPSFPGGTVSVAFVSALDKVASVNKVMLASVRILAAASKEDPSLGPREHSQKVSEDEVIKRFPVVSSFSALDIVEAQRRASALDAVCLGLHVCGLTNSVSPTQQIGQEENWVRDRNQGPKTGICRPDDEQMIDSIKVQSAESFC